MNAGIRDSALEDELRRRTGTAMKLLSGTQIGNLINGISEREETTQPEALQAREAEVEALHTRYSTYFDAAERVAQAESKADLPRFRSLRREQLARARAADGFLPVLAAPLRLAGVVLPFAALAGRGFELISVNALLGAWVLSVVLYQLGRLLGKKRTSPFWFGVFNQPAQAARAAWFLAAESAAASLVRERERSHAGFAAGLEAVDQAWAARDSRSTHYADDYSGFGSGF